MTTPTRRAQPATQQMEMIVKDFEQLAELYIAAWNETDPAVRRQLIDEVWAPNGRYVDPLAAVEGRDGIDATIEAVQGQFPGLKFSLAGPVDAHHDQARFIWELGPDGGDPIVVGFDVAERDAEGRLALVLGFLDKIPT
jgi:hypothetical protein